MSEDPYYLSESLRKSLSDMSSILIEKLNADESFDMFAEERVACKNDGILNADINNTKIIIDAQEEDRYENALKLDSLSHIVELEVENNITSRKLSTIPQMNRRASAKNLHKKKESTESTLELMHIWQDIMRKRDTHLLDKHSKTIQSVRDSKIPLRTKINASRKGATIKSRHRTKPNCKPKSKEKSANQIKVRRTDNTIKSRSQKSKNRSSLLQKVKNLPEESYSSKFIASKQNEEQGINTYRRTQQGIYFNLKSLKENLSIGRKGEIIKRDNVKKSISTIQRGMKKGIKEKPRDSSHWMCHRISGAQESYVNESRGSCNENSRSIINHNARKIGIKNKRINNTQTLKSLISSKGTPVPHALSPYSTYFTVKSPASPLGYGLSSFPLAPN